MKKQQHTNGNRPVTVSQLENILQNSFSVFEKKLDKRFMQINKKFKQIDCRFDIVNAKLAAFIGINTMNIDRAINALEERQNKQFNKIFTKIDEFLKRTEENEEEILLLGKQHDNLAKYCTEKIGYPVYGRN